MLNTIQICSIVIGLLSCLVIAVKHRRNSYQKVLLLLFIFSLTFYCFMVYLVKGGLILEYPHFFKTGSPFLYLNPIVFFLFVKSVVRNQQRPQTIDLILLAIPLLNFLELLPFYMKDAQFKIDLITQISSKEDAIYYTREGVLPTFWHYTLQTALGVVFSVLPLTMLLKSKREKKTNAAVAEHYWLVWVSLLIFSAYAITMVALLTDSPSLNVHKLTSYLLAFVLLSVIVYLFMEPRILYGKTPFRKKKLNAKHDIQSNLSDVELLTYKKSIDDFFINESAYLRADFRQDNLASFLSVSRNKFSQITIDIYKKNFNQLINEKRINVVLKKFKNSEWLNYSLDGVAHEVGFKSRTTFIKAFKVKTGVTPSEYKKKYVASSP